MKFMQRHGLPHQQTSPGHRAGPRKPGFQLQNRFCLRRSTGIYHPKKLHEPFKLANRSLTPRILVVPYYGLTGNGKQLSRFRDAVVKSWKRWFGRRHRDGRTAWGRLRAILARFPLLAAKVTHSIYAT